MGTPWYAARLNLKVPVRVFGNCDPNSFWFSQSENGTVLHGPGPELLQVFLPYFFCSEIRHTFLTHEQAVFGNNPLKSYKRNINVFDMYLPLAQSLLNLTLFAFL